MISTPETRAIAQEVFDRINANPACHNQNSWGSRSECGTAMCVAGHTVDIARPDLVEWFDWVGGGRAIMSTIAGEPDIGTVAAGLLGLSEDESNKLFYADEEDAVQILKKVIVGEDFHLTD